MIIVIITAVVALILGGLCGFLIFRYVIKGKYKKKKKLLEVKEKFLNKKSELEKEVQQRNQHIQQNENRLKQREISLNQRQEELGRRKNDLDNQQTRIDNEKKLLALKNEELEKMQLQERTKLEELSGLSAEEAKARLVEAMKDEVNAAKTLTAAEKTQLLKEIDEYSKELHDSDYSLSTKINLKYTLARARDLTIKNLRLSHGRSTSISESNDKVKVDAELQYSGLKDLAEAFNEGKRKYLKKQ